jgi:hypothetical protein
MSSSSSMSFVDPYRIQRDDQGHIIWTVWVFNESAFNKPVPSDEKSKNLTYATDLLSRDRSPMCYELFGKDHDHTKCPTRHISKL